MRLMHYLIICVICLLVRPAFALQPDFAREKNLSMQVALVDGEAVYLEAKGHKFFNAFIEPDRKKKGAVIVIHGRGLHPDWPGIAKTVRTQLPNYGWSTFAIQMPVLSKKAEFKDYVQIFPYAVPRIDAAIRYLKALGYKKIHLMAHSCGAQMTMAWVDGGGGKEIDSLALVSLGMTKFQRHFGHRPAFDRLPIPILDIYGAKDFVKKRAAERKSMLEKAGNRHSKQVAIEGGKHMMKKQSAEVVDVLGHWLNGLPE